MGVNGVWRKCCAIELREGQNCFYLLSIVFERVSV